MKKQLNFKTLKQWWFWKIIKFFEKIEIKIIEWDRSAINNYYNYNILIIKILTIIYLLFPIYLQNYQNNKI